MPLVALIMEGDIVVGYHPDVTAVANSGAKFIKSLTVPPEFLTLKENEQLRRVGSKYVVEQLPPPPLSEVEQLRNTVEEQERQINELTVTLGDLMLGGL